MRTSRLEWFLDIALRCAHQTTCLRRGFGAVIVDERYTIVSTGYNGAPRGSAECTAFGYCWRKRHNIPSGFNYEKCRSVHAEMNALIQAGKYARGSVLYLAGFDVDTGEVIDSKPCALCSRMIINAGIKEVIAKSKNTFEGFKVYAPFELEGYWNDILFTEKPA